MSDKIINKEDTDCNNDNQKDDEYVYVDRHNVGILEELILYLWYFFHNYV